MARNPVIGMLISGEIKRGWTMADVRKGGCLCGAVRFEATAPLREVVVCHCGQCRKWHGAPPYYTAVELPRFRVTKGDQLAWFDSSPQAKRGFCKACGSSLFWQGAGRDYISFTAGSLDGATHLKTARHIHVADKADFYDVADGLPRS